MVLKLIIQINKLQKLFIRELIVLNDKNVIKRFLTTYLTKKLEGNFSHLITHKKKKLVFIFRIIVIF